MNMQTLCVSSKGQVVLPISMRKELGIEEGSNLVAYQKGDFIMLKKVDMPSKEEFDEFLAKSQAWAKAVGLTEEDVTKAIKEVRLGK